MALNTTTNTICSPANRYIYRYFAPISSKHSVGWQVVMPAGVLPGHTITFGGKGAQHPGQRDGNLRFVAVLLPHARFEREGEKKIGSR